MTDYVQVKDGRDLYDPWDDVEDKAPDHGFIWLPEAKQTLEYRHYPGHGTSHLECSRITMWPVGNTDKAEKVDAAAPWVYGRSFNGLRSVSATSMQFNMTKHCLRDLARMTLRLPPYDDEKGTPLRNI